MSDALLAVTDILVVNEGEGRRLTGADGPEAIGAALQRRVGKAAIVTLGADGAILFQAGGEPLRRSAHAVEVVDTTGAGDAFIGALAARLAAGHEAGEALAWGLSAGALACTRLGATDSFAEAAAIAALAAKSA
jgi:ribokinase